MRSQGYGSARWASRAEVRREGLTQGAGVVVGTMGWGPYKTLIRIGGEDHTLVIGPAGSGKSVGVILPTLLSYPHSVICLDLKGTLLDQTFAYRRSLGPVYVFDPIWGPDAINPFDFVRWGTPAEVMDVQRIINHVTYVDAETRNDASQYYLRETQPELMAMSLYLYHSKIAPCTIGGLLKIFSGLLHSLQSTGTYVTHTLKQMQACGHETVRDWASMLLQENANDQRKLFSAARGWLMTWLDPLLDRYTSHTTLTLDHFQRSPDPATLYIRVSAEDIQGRLLSVIRMILDLLSARLSDRGPGQVASDFLHEILLVLDDFAELKHFSLINRLAAFLRESGFRLLAAAQSFGQIWEEYGPDAGLLDNCGTWVLFRPNSPRTARFIAEKLGEATVAERVVRTTTPVMGLGVSRSRGEHLHARPLLDAGELLRLPRGRHVVCARGLNLLVKTVRYYHDQPFKSRAA